MDFGFPLTGVESADIRLLRPTDVEIRELFQHVDGAAEDPDDPTAIVRFGEVLFLGILAYRNERRLADGHYTDKNRREFQAKLQEKTEALRSLVVEASAYDRTHDASDEVLVGLGEYLTWNGPRGEAPGQSRPFEESQEVFLESCRMSDAELWLRQLDDDLEMLSLATKRAYEIVASRDGYQTGKTRWANLGMLRALCSIYSFATGEEPRSYDREAEGPTAFEEFVERFYRVILRPRWPDAEIKVSYVRDHLTEAKGKAAKLPGYKKTSS